MKANRFYALCVIVFLSYCSLLLHEASFQSYRDEIIPAGRQNHLLNRSIVARKYIASRSNDVPGTYWNITILNFLSVNRMTKNPLALLKIYFHRAVKYNYIYEYDFFLTKHHHFKNTLHRWVCSYLILHRLSTMGMVEYHSVSNI